MEYSTFRRKPEVCEYEGKLKQLEQNLRGLSNQQDQDFYAQRRSLSREQNNNNINQETSRRLLMIEDRLEKQVFVILKRKEQRAQEYEIKIKKVVERMCCEIDSQPWMGVAENIRNKLISKILMIEDKFTAIHNEVWSKLSQIMSIVDNKTQTYSTKDINQQQQFEVHFQDENQMVKKCIDDQNSMVNEFKLFKKNIGYELSKLQNGQHLESTAKFEWETQNQPSNPTVRKDTQKQIFKEGDTQYQNLISRLSTMEQEQSQKHRSKALSQYKEVQQQRDDQISKQITKARKPTEKGITFVLIHQEQELNTRSSQEQSERTSFNERDDQLVRKSSDRIQRNSSRSKHE